MAISNPDHLDPYYIGRYTKGDFKKTTSDDSAMGLRGYPAGTEVFNRIVAGTLEYRLPIFQTDAGFLTVPVMFRNLWINLFFDYGQVWDEDEGNGFYDYFNDFDYKNFKSSVGIELNIELMLGYRFPVQGTIAYARGFNDMGEDQIYFKIATLYEGAFSGNQRNRVPISYH